MSLLAEVGTITFGNVTGGTNQTFNLADSGLTPKAIIVFSVQNHGGTIQNANWCSIGFGTRRGGATQSGTVGVQSANNVGTTDNSRVRDTTLLSTIASSSALFFNVTLVSFAAGQFTVSVNVNAQGQRMAYIVFGGDDITDAIVLNHTMASTGSTEAITGAGFQPDMVFALDSDLVTANSLTAGYSFSFGAASSPSLFRAVHVNQNDAQAMTSGQTNHTNFSTSDCLLRDTNTADTSDAAWDLNSFDSDGLTLGVNNAPSATDRVATFLLIKGGTWEVGSQAKDTVTGTDTFTLANSALTPKCAIMFGRQSTTATGLLAGVASFGFGATSGSTGGCAALFGDEADPTVQRLLGATDACFEKISSSAEVDRAGFSSFGAGNFVLDWATNSGAADIIGFVAAGDSPASNPTPPAGSLSLTGLAPFNDRGVIVPTEVNV